MHLPATRLTRRCGRLLAAAAVAAMATPAWANPSLTWDAPGTSPAAPADGSGTWTGGPTWSNGTADVPWADGADATIGTGTATAPFTINLAANLSAGSIQFGTPATNVVYTINGNGYTLAVPAGNVNAFGASVTLTNGTFSTGDASGSNFGGFVLQGGATLRLGTGATLATADIVGNNPPNTVYFDGGTLRALANPTTSPPYFVSVVGTSNAYVSTGGLTFDTAPVAAGVCYITDPLLHDPAAPAADEGLTVAGGGTLQLGFSRQVPAFNPVSTYTGTTTVTGNTTLRLDTAGNTTATTGTPGTGPFPNTRFVVGPGSTLAVSATDAVAGETGTTPVTLNGGTITLLSAASAHLAGVTLNGGTMTAAAGATGQYTVLAGGELHATATAAVTGPLAFDAGSDVRTDVAATLSIASPVIDGDGPGQLTVVGSGTVTLSGAGTYTGPTNVAGGTVRLTAAGSLAGTPSITVGSGAALSIDGTIAAAPTLTTAGSVLIDALPGSTGRSVRTLGVTAVNAGGTLTLAPSPTSASRSVLVIPSVAIAPGAKLDVGDGDLVIHATSPANAAAQLAALTAAAATGFAGGTWAGTGLTSSAAAADARHLTAVGVIQNATAVGGLTPIYTSFDGQPATAADVLVRYTLYGDANLDGVVNAADYARIDAGFLTGLTGWQNGDYNGDGVVDGSDYTLMDNAFNQQSNAVASPASVLSGGVAATPAVAVVVPEPATLLGWFLVLVGTARHRRRRRPNGRSNQPA